MSGVVGVEVVCELGVGVDERVQSELIWSN